MQIGNTDLINNERCDSNKSTEEINQNEQIENNDLNDYERNNHDKNHNLENNTNNVQSNNDITDTSINPININKCANCFRQNHKDQHSRYNIRFHSIKSSKIRHQGTFKFIKKKSGRHECDYILCDECKEYLVKKR